MHIPDGFLDPKISTGLIGAAATVLGLCFAKVAQAVTALAPVKAMATTAGNISGGMRRVLTPAGEKTIYKMGMAAALVFAAQMFNFPISGGTSGHLIGGVFAAVALGPFAGAIVIATVLGVQSLFFADGGLMALGANIINMAVIASIGCYYIYFFIKKIAPEWIAVSIAAWSSVVLAASACALEIGASGTIGLSSVFPAMLKVHVVIGIAEALITLAFINFFRSMLKEETE